MWQLNERRAERRERIWEIRWTDANGMSGEDLLDAVEETLESEGETTDESRLVRWASGVLPALDVGASTRYVRPDEVAGCVLDAMSAIAGAPQKQLVLGVSIASPARRSA